MFPVCVLQEEFSCCSLLLESKLKKIKETALVSEINLFSFSETFIKKKKKDWNVSKYDCLVFLIHDIIILIVKIQ